MTRASHLFEPHTTAWMDPLSSTPVLLILGPRWTFSSALTWEGEVDAASLCTTSFEMHHTATAVAEAVAKITERDRDLVTLGV